MTSYARGSFKVIRTTRHGHEVVQKLEDAYLDHLAADPEDKRASYASLGAAREKLYRYVATLETEAGRLLTGNRQDTVRVRFK